MTGNKDILTLVINLYFPFVERLQKCRRLQTFLSRFLPKSISMVFGHGIFGKGILRGMTQTGEFEGSSDLVTHVDVDVHEFCPSCRCTVLCSPPPHPLHGTGSSAWCRLLAAAVQQVAFPHSQESAGGGQKESARHGLLNAIAIYQTCPKYESEHI